eukprot:CAMPEP_0171086856 /NCGR_PEP_ID=MMETSP0766_2-20121228/19798_1 /TAXON_ID=439317 /ORGANISM="Gambierdiscus australes, Strain CAWD 149" /LENGTH=214 /DNA_ID=CAMNT_0011544527 /DNA_START=83 /DNA_END=727 /DNA_ORIENTATION=+
MMRTQLLFALLALASASRARRSPTNSTLKVERLKSQVVASKAFQDKLSERCNSKDSSCKSTATEVLFCTMLQRKKPELAEAHCGGAAPDSKFAVVKAHLMSSKGFNETALRLSRTLGCSDVPKATTCASYVKDVAFCLLFADKMATFQNMTGAEDEARSCKIIDSKLPKLSMLVQQQPTKPVLAQVSARLERRAQAPSDELAKEMAHDLESKLN